MPHPMDISRREFLAGSAAMGAAAALGLTACSAQGTSEAAATSAATQSGQSVRDMIYGIDEKVTLADGSQRAAVCFDNAATTPAFKAVKDEVDTELLSYGSIGRGAGQKSTHCNDVYTNGRQTILDFLGAGSDKYTAIYTANTTDGLNKLARSLVTSKDQVVISTRMEHHANDLPWRDVATMLYADVDAQGRLKMDDIEALLAANEGKVRLVTVTAASNVTGYFNDIHAIAKLAHAHGAMIVVDGAQAVAHRSLSMRGDSEDADIDFIAFSAHKMYAPYGGGAIVGLTSVLNTAAPPVLGGGIVDLVTENDAVFLPAPARFEAGSPNYPGVVSMLKAMGIIQGIGFDYIENHEHELLQRTLDGLRQIDGATLYGDCDDIDDRGGIVVFNIDGHWCTDVAKTLADEAGIAVRAGMFCSHVYSSRLLGVSDAEIEANKSNASYRFPNMVRASIGVYNTADEVDTLVDEVARIAADTASATTV
ncbi:MAG: aminotransferase class V-fold PLP-dependent enzyme [Atopobiaceae bacterium]|nr:aminotransferase class V-fold PLP-dependent enzyme [Atopobiaceae bacterium]MDD3485880.1 aminotransferase class V-fold PLP-dependent enzyme [Atopobiaceae bacterium]